MAESAVLLVDEVLPEAPMCQWVLSFPFPLRFLFASQPGKVLTLQTLPAIDEPLTTRAGNVAGFSLHARVAEKAHERNKLERLCRYVTRPAVSEKHLSLTEQCHSKDTCPSGHEYLGDFGQPYTLSSGTLSG